MALSARNLAQLAFVAHFDADAITNRYAWPPREALSTAEVDQIAHLEAISTELFERAEALGWEGGTDAAFGAES